MSEAFRRLGEKSRGRCSRPMLTVWPVHKPTDLMNPGERRALTPGEVALGRTVFGDEIDWPRVRVRKTSPRGCGALGPIGKTIVFSKGRAARDFSKASLDEQGWFVHELTHVWQAACGCVLAGAKLGALGKGAYIYKHRPEAHLAQPRATKSGDSAL